MCVQLSNKIDWLIDWYSIVRMSLHCPVCTEAIRSQPRKRLTSPLLCGACATDLCLQHCFPLLAKIDNWHMHNYPEPAFILYTFMNMVARPHRFQNRSVQKLSDQCCDTCSGLSIALDHWLKGSNPTCSRDLFLFWLHSALPKKLSRRFTFGGDIKLLVPRVVSSLTGSSPASQPKKSTPQLGYVQCSFQAWVDLLKFDATAGYSYHWSKR